MSGNIAPNTITDNLVLYLDAANNKSYVSGSTSWLDLTPNQSNSGSLTNGPIFNTGSGGNIVFDGTNDYAVITDTTPSWLLGDPSFTVCGWFKRNGDWNSGEGKADPDDEKR